MKGLFTYVVFCLVLQVNLFAQNPAYSNIGFEEGTLRGWSYSKGEVETSPDLLRLRFIDDTLGYLSRACRLTTLADGNDSLITQETIPMVAPGSRYSIRLGDDEVGAQFDRIRTSLLVSEETALFQYKFAVVLQDPDHHPIQQPALRIRILDATGQSIPCGSYEVSAARTINGFESQGRLRYRNWTTGLIDLRPFLGQHVQIEVTSNDCARGGHFGYAYFDAAVFKAAINQTTSCAERDTTLTLLAPAGFDQYEWNTGDTTNRLVIKPRMGDRYSVQVRSYSSLAENCQLRLDYEVTYPASPTEQQVTICAGGSYQVGDSAYSKPGRYVTYFRRPPPGCDSISIVRIYVVELPVTPLTNQVISVGDRVQLGTAELGSANVTFRWKPETGLTCLTCPTTWAMPSKTTQYTLITQSETPYCRVDRPVTVMVNPCYAAIPNAFTPNGDGLNDLFTVAGSPCWKRLIDMTLFDRWGNVLFHEQNKLPVSWNGTYEDQPVSIGVYTYKLRVELVNGTLFDHTGTVSLLR